MNGCGSCKKRCVSVSSATTCTHSSMDNQRPFQAVGAVAMSCARVKRAGFFAVRTKQRRSRCSSARPAAWSVPAAVWLAMARKTYVTRASSRRHRLFLPRMMSNITSTRFVQLRSPAIVRKNSYCCQLGTKSARRLFGRNQISQRPRNSGSNATTVLAGAFMDCCRFAWECLCVSRITSIVARRVY